jgi:hypothetical protein
MGGERLSLFCEVWFGDWYQGGHNFSSVAGQTRFVALTPCIPLARLAGEGEGAPPCAPTPLSHKRERGWGEGLTPAPEVEQHGQQVGVVHDAVAVQVSGVQPRRPEVEQHG